MHFFPEFKSKLDRNEVRILPTQLIEKLNQFQDAHYPSRMEIGWPFGIRSYLSSLEAINLEQAMFLEDYVKVLRAGGKVEWEHWDERARRLITAFFDSDDPRKFLRSSSAIIENLENTIEKGMY